MFDKIYVLSKGGKCVFEGKPHDLRQTLLNNNMKCDKTDVPIEELLRISSEGKDNQKVIDLSEEQSVKQNKLKKRIIKENMHSFIELVYKRFSFNDFYYLLKRTMITTFISNWFLTVVQSIFQFFSPIFAINFFNKKMIESSGCIEWSLDSGCNKSVEELNNETLILENLKYLLTMVLSIPSVNIVIIINSFVSGIKIFENEHYNGNYIMKIF